MNLSLTSNHKLAQKDRTTPKEIQIVPISWKIHDYSFLAFTRNCHILVAKLHQGTLHFPLYLYFFVWNCGSPEFAIYLIADRTTWEETFAHWFWSTDPLFWASTQYTKCTTRSFVQGRVKPSHAASPLLW